VIWTKTILEENLRACKMDIGNGTRSKHVHKKRKKVATAATEQTWEAWHGGYLGVGGMG
jgi:hypothetical protein